MLADIKNLCIFVSDNKTKNTNYENAINTRFKISTRSIRLY